MLLLAAIRADVFFFSYNVDIGIMGKIFNNWKKRNGTQIPV